MQQVLILNNKIKKQMYLYLKLNKLKQNNILQYEIRKNSLKLRKQILYKK